MLALIAGTGDLPVAILSRLPTRPLVCAMSGFRPAITPNVTFRIEELGSLLRDLKARGVNEVCMAGAVQRPVIDPAAIDALTQPLVPQIMQAIAQGDDGALRAIIAIFEDAGITVRAAHDIAPDLMPSEGVQSNAPVTFDMRRDAVTAEQTISEMGKADVGQACLVRNGRVLAREGQVGTDAMLDRFSTGNDAMWAWAPVDQLGEVLGDAAEWLSGADGEPVDARGALLFKAPKPDQDRRADLPVIGPQTAQRAVDIGLAGIVIECGGVMVLDEPAVRATLDAGGLVFWVRPKGGA